ncbi:MAG: hypothetical protein NVS4B12_25020 [Ktedonobacteraceae bacterium]
MAIEKDFFRQVLGRFATGVTVVTTNNKGTISGLTVNAFCSVSLEPPLVLVCVDLSSNALLLIRESKNFAVNILTNEQEYLSRCFATPSTERYENFCHAEYATAVTGAPILDGVLAFIDARVVAEYPGGDHIIFLGQVEAIGTPSEVEFVQNTKPEQSTVVTHEAHVEEASPLGYYRGQYRHFTSTYKEPSLDNTNQYEKVPD